MSDPSIMQIIHRRVAVAPVVLWCGCLLGTLLYIGRLC